MAWPLKRIAGWAALILMIGVPIIGLWLVAFFIPSLMRDLYGQWGAAEMVISFHKARDRLPTNWQELKPFYNGEDAPHHGNGDFDDLRKTIVIDFAQLVEIEHRATVGNDGSHLPEAIQTTSGRQSSWSGAEPNELLFGYLRELSKHEEPRWMPRISTVPSNHLKFYLVFGQAMTQGDMFSHLELLDETTDKPVPGAFRETELWSPDGNRFTLWLHPGRQKTGVNLNEDEGPVLTEGHLYALVLKHTATTTEGNALPKDVVQRFAVGPADHTMPDPKRWTITAPRAGTLDPLVVKFDEALDWSMLRESIHPPNGIGTERITVNDAGTEWRFIPRINWDAGEFSIGIDTNLEDLAGNNLLHPFETDATKPSSNNESKAFTLNFDVR